MRYFVKAKFPVLPNEAGQLVQRVDEKIRFDNRDNAFDWIAMQLEAGAASVVIRAEDRT